ncbi:MAG: triose-phosphate transporter family protein [Firmicutes bacterium]|nr:triose-phosphate transporter family protein [[Eubacterium] siraeum]MCM1487877.1 triose-phosphate transporter family protein [Bacillota bacterium]
MGKIKHFLILNLILLFYSLGGILSKTAAGKPFLSLEFILLYGGMLFILGVYAILWQQIIKHIPLNVAYANKAVCLIWGMIWGAVIFKEQITLSNLIGAAVVIAGVLLMVTGGEKKNE